ncbi:hypothetical protein AB6A40_000873 [Gnathostoma spinigerum]|uniref:Clc-like protein n=1 Tax=Gnathostoma spinigerum TaxID=75299 RepID=A0ABD6E9X8_9BILA
MRAHGVETRKPALCIFFVLAVLSFVLSLLAFISPSWQYVFLENGRTVHHHGLWMDCKRDFSHEYGRNREFYEILYRLDDQQSPFYRFFLPPLNCVYKFDYYIDPEDLYEHNYDENRLQGDAYQHLFLGWKIAVLVALGLGLIVTTFALIIAIFAFCHRTLTCVSTVFFSMSTVLSAVGLLVFYVWGNYQDNKMIKEEDATYQQFFGWAFYVEILSIVSHFLASLCGCLATAVALRKNKAKLVRIDIIDANGSTLLSDCPEQFKHSISAVYKVDSATLGQWRKDDMDKNLSGSGKRKGKRNSRQVESTPHIEKLQHCHTLRQNTARFANSATNSLFEGRNTDTLRTNATDETDLTHSYSSSAINAVKSDSKRTMKLNVPLQITTSLNGDVTYESLPCNEDFISSAETYKPSVNSSSRRSATLSTSAKSFLQRSAMNVYDQAHDDGPVATISITGNSYERPYNYRLNSSNGFRRSKELKSIVISGKDSHFRASPTWNNVKSPSILLNGTDRSTGSSTALYGGDIALDASPTYSEDDKLRLNLFLNGHSSCEFETELSAPFAQVKENGETTV